MVRLEFENKTENEKQIHKFRIEESVEYFGCSNVFVLFVEEVVFVVENVVEN